MFLLCSLLVLVVYKLLIRLVLVLCLFSLSSYFSHCYDSSTLIFFFLFLFSPLSYRARQKDGNENNDSFPLHVLQELLT